MPAGRPRSGRDNAVKGFVSDPVYEGLERFRSAHGIESESLAINRLLEIALFGMVGSVRPSPDFGRPLGAISVPQIERRRAS